jgi:hypothetical protein
MNAPTPTEDPWTSNTAQPRASGEWGNKPIVTTVKKNITHERTKTIRHAMPFTMPQRAHAVKVQAYQYHREKRQHESKKECCANTS